MLTKTSKLKLNNGTEIPIVGFGTYLIEPGVSTKESVRTALKAGYRHIDTAAFYGNESDVGNVIKSSEIPREELFVTTKVWNSDQGYDRTLHAFDKSMGKLGLEHVDLYLIHWPLQATRRDTWKALEKIYEEGRAKAIGVSNYMINHLFELADYSPVVPAVNQVEFSPFLFQHDLLDFCRNKGIVLEAYSSLTRGQRMHDSKLKQMAVKYNKSEAQLLLRWAIEHQVVIIPKSVTPSRIYENIDLFDFSISHDDLAEMDSWNENYRVAWDPTTIK